MSLTRLVIKLKKVIAYFNITQCSVVQCFYETVIVYSVPIIILQARVDRLEFSSEGVYLSDNGVPPSQLPSNTPPTNDSGPHSPGVVPKHGSLKRGLSSNLKFSHFVTMESGDVLKAATTDLVRIFQLQVRGGVS